MFTFNVSKQLNVWAVPNFDISIDADPNEYIDIKDEQNDDKESAANVMLEIQAIKNLQYSCDICEKKFATRDERNVHIDSHFKTYTCKTCEENFIGDRQFEHHRLSNKCVSKKRIKSITYECFECHKANFFTGT